MVVLSHLTLALVHLDQHAWLVVRVRSKGLLLLGWDTSVSGDQHSHDATGSLNALRKGSDIEKEKVLDLLTTLTLEDSSLDSGTVGDGLIWVDRSVELLAVEEVGEHGLDFGDTGGASDEDDFVDLVLADIRVREDLLDGRHALAEGWEAQLLELGAGNVDAEVLTLSEGLAVDFRLMGSGENSLGLLALGSKTAHGTGVALDIDASLLLELGDAVVDKHIVEVLASQVSVTVRGLHFEDSVFNREQRYIKSATTEIKDEHILLALALLVETVSDGGSSRLIDDTLYVQTGNGAGVLGSLSLRVIEVGWDSDDSRGDSLAEVSLSDLLHLAEDHGRDLLSLELLLLALKVDLDERLLTWAGYDLKWPESDIVLHSSVAKLATNQALGVEHGVGWVSGDLVLGGVTNETLLLSESNVGWGGVDTLVVGDDLDAIVLPHSNAGVSGSQIDSDGC